MAESDLSLPELHYTSCQKVTPYNLSMTLNDALENVSSEDKALLGLIFCLKENYSPRLTQKVKIALIPKLVALFKQVRALSQKHLNTGIIVISKTHRLVFFAKNGEIDRNMVDRIALGVYPLDNGDKQRIHDHRTPEGEYLGIQRPGSKYRCFLGVNYPTVQQAEKAQKEEKIDKGQLRAIKRAHEKGKMPPSNTKLGGLIGLHGGPKKNPENTDVSATKKDWSLGCITAENHMACKHYDKGSVPIPIIILH